jgi:hypothetical protein
VSGTFAASSQVTTSPDLITEIWPGVIGAARP